MDKYYRLYNIEDSSSIDKLDVLKVFICDHSKLDTAELGSLNVYLHNMDDTKNSLSRLISIGERTISYITIEKRLRNTVENDKYVVSHLDTSLPGQHFRITNIHKTLDYYVALYDDPITQKTTSVNISGVTEPNNVTSLVDLFKAL